MIKFATLLGVLGTNELVIIFFLVFLLVIPGYFIYKYGKNKGRIQEMERRIKENNQAK